MKTKANPVYASGSRNVLCPFYESCLDYAVEHHWRYWTCKACPHRVKKVRLTRVPMVKDSSPEYAIPADLL